MNYPTATLLALALLPTLAMAQDAPKLPPPTLGPLVSYTYWPTQYVQWIGAELPFSMIELDVNKDGKTPLLYVSLTDRTTGKRIHYTDNDGLLATAKAGGEEAHKSPIAFESDDTESPGSTATLRLTLADGKLLQWRFVQGSDISEQGSGLTPLPAASIPIFVYREQGAVAGEGTALQIGNVVSTAEVWKEISHPPQFIAYRGAVTKGAHTVVFRPGTDTWTVASAPTALTLGATWELDSPTGDHRTLKIDKANGTQVTLTGSDRFQPAVRFTIEAERGPAGWSLASVRYAPVREGEKHFALLSFTAPLSSTPGSSDLALTIGRKKPIANGTLRIAASASQPTTEEHTLTLDFATPAWAHGKTLTETVSARANVFTTVAHP